MTTTTTNASLRSRKSTPIALIEAAERLFGQHGIEAVSLRQIRLEAGAANNSAITYHFDDREKLVRAIWESRLPALDAARRVLLDRMYERGLQHDPDAVIRALIMPNYDLKDSHGVHRYAAFFRHALRWKHGAAIRNAQLNDTPASSEAMELLYALRPGVTRSMMDYRMRHGACVFFDMIFERDEEIAAGRPVMPEDAFLAEGIDMLRAICLRP